MITTKQVRAIMKSHGREEIYTNKAKSDAVDVRRVKCYAPTNRDRFTALQEDLIKQAGFENVGMAFNDGFSFIVRAKIA